MSTSTTLPSVEDLKSQAKRLRTALATEGDLISHSEALELMAKQNGYRDWNTLRAAASRTQPKPLAVGANVSGHYLGHAFTGRLVTVKVAIQLDQPIDVVRSEHFSGLRRRITGVIDALGKSAEKTSDGTPHLVVRT